MICNDPEELKTLNLIGFYQLWRKVLTIYKNKISRGALNSGPYKFHYIVLNETKRYQPCNKRTAYIEAKYARKYVQSYSGTMCIKFHT